jgi:hypothetical protein
MSRGLGKVERAILAALAPTGEARVVGLRCAMPEFDKTVISRALRSLHDKKFISEVPDRRSWNCWEMSAYVRRVALTPEGRAAIGARLKIGPLGRLSVNSVDFLQNGQVAKSEEIERVGTYEAQTPLSVNSKGFGHLVSENQSGQTERVGAYEPPVSS